MTDQVPAASRTLPDIAAVLRHGLGTALNPEAVDLIAMCAEDVVFEFPFAPPGAPERIEGRAALEAYLGQIGRMVDLGAMTLLEVHPSTEDGVFVLEFSARATSLANGRDLTQRYIAVIRIAGGRIVHYRDYWNPLVVAAALEKADG